MPHPARHHKPTGLARKGSDELCIDTIRTLAIDAVEHAKSGHAGTPMGLAPVAFTLWQQFLRYDPADPLWPNRDRFVLSAGHASMMLYALLHLARVQRVENGEVTREAAVSLDDIRHFRQIDSVTPGHPEHGHTTGVEVTTGPLGQGCGNSVGMAMASRWLAARYNRPGHTLFDFDVYTICSDGDMMEGVASEAASLAGHLALDNLCWIYDSNTVTIEGHTDLAFDENVEQRFRGYRWNVVHVRDANDTVSVARALQTFRGHRGQPTLIIVNSVIGYGAPTKQNTAAAHSDPLGAAEVRKAKEFYRWPEDRPFLVPDQVYECFADSMGQRGATQNTRWQILLNTYEKQHPDEAKELRRNLGRELPGGWDSELPEFATDDKGMATREASGKVLNALAAKLPWLIGGSADLAPSTKTKFEDRFGGNLEARSPGGRTLHFGIREHAMGAIINGLGACGLRAFGATFLVFSDYMRPPIRLAALMRLPVFHVFTHDSIGVGEDGPTHQPIEQLAGLRAIPNLLVLRPADANEVTECYRIIMQLADKPACLVLSRQPLPIFDRKSYGSAAGVARGAYVLADADRPRVILIGTGSEVQLCIEAYEKLKADGIASRVVSMPSWELFEQQDQAYRDRVLPPDIAARVTVEQAALLGWDRYAGPSGAMLGMRTFGASAPLKDLLKKFGFTSEHVVAAAREQIARHERDKQ
jgi:transketolase